jgi:glycosyltransferase involved in cell wall biosynthesis
LFKDIPTVVTFHDLYGLKGWIHSQKSILWGFLGHLVTYFSTKCMYDKIIAVSPQCKQKLLSVGVPHEKIMVIPNGVDIKLFDSTEVVKVPNQILYVGRLVNFKHVDWLIKAFYKVLKYLPDAQLKIVGWGPEWYSLKKLVRSLGLEKHIIFTGRTPTYEDVVRYYKESEVFVLPSTVEGEAIVLKEAMAARLPVIAIDVKGSGVLSIVRDGHNGFLVKPGDIDSIAKRIINLLENKELAREIGDRGRRFVEKYDWNRVAEMVYIVYREVYEKEKS